MLIELVGQRRIRARPSSLVKALDNSDQAVRSAALTALGETVSAKELSVLISQVVAPKHAEDVPVAQQALQAACIRMPDREACAAELAAAMTDASTPTKSPAGNPGRRGRTKALAPLGAAAKSDDAAAARHRQPRAGRVDDGRRGAGAVGSGEDGPRRQVPGPRTARLHPHRAAVRHARQQRAEMCQQRARSLPVSQPNRSWCWTFSSATPAWRRSSWPSKPCKMPELKGEAADTALAITQKLGGKVDEVRETARQAGLER